MSRLLQTELDKYLEAANGPNMMRQAYLHIYDHFPAMFKEDCPYEKDSWLAFHAIGSDESLVAFSMFVAWGFDIQTPDIQKGHFCVYVKPKVHQVKRLIDFIEQNFPDECSEVQAWVDTNKEQRKAEVDATIMEYVNSNYERVDE